MRVPILRKYRVRFYLQSFGRNISFAAVVILLAVFGIPLFLHTAFGLLKLAGIFLATVGLASAFEIYFPRKLGVTIHEDWIEYEFTSEAYARAFAALNAARIIKIH